VGNKNYNEIESDQKVFTNIIMRNLNFLFCNNIDKERLEWICNIIGNHYLKSKSSKYKYKIKIFLTGESLYSLIDGRMHELWIKILTFHYVKIYIDHSELVLFGVSVDFLKEAYPNNFFLISENNQNRISFWEYFIDTIYSKNFTLKFGFLQNSGPYMERTSLYALRLINAAINYRLNPEYYGYLDGVHLGHKGQNPSEFENIASMLIETKSRAKQKNLNFSMLSCLRCGTARGYIRSQPTNDLYESDDTIPSYYFGNLNKIIDQFEYNFPILSSNSAIITQDTQENHSNPGLIIFITHSPYSSEWSFGGVSFAVASASHNIPTQVIFIESGVYCMVGEHAISENDKIFNLQEILEASVDMEFLNFYAYAPSLKIRDILPSNDLKSVSLIGNEELTNIVLKNSRKGLYHKRIIFF